MFGEMDLEKTKVAAMMSGPNAVLWKTYWRCDLMLDQELLCAPLADSCRVGMLRKTLHELRSVLSQAMQL